MRIIFTRISARPPCCTLPWPTFSRTPSSSRTFIRKSLFTLAHSMARRSSKCTTIAADCRLERLKRCSRHLPSAVPTGRVWVSAWPSLGTASRRTSARSPFEMCLARDASSPSRFRCTWPSDREQTGIARCQRPATGIARAAARWGVRAVRKIYTIAEPPKAQVPAARKRVLSAIEKKINALQRSNAPKSLILGRISPAYLRKARNEPFWKPAFHVSSKGHRRRGAHSIRRGSRAPAVASPPVPVPPRPASRRVTSIRPSGAWRR